MSFKENGWILAIDQASNVAGVSLWYFGKLQATTKLLSNKASDPLPKRLQTQVPQLTAFLQQHLPAEQEVSTVIFEGVRARLVALVVGAFLTCPLLVKCRISPKTSFVESQSWKIWAKRRGATGPVKDVKGVKALRDVGFPVDLYEVDSDDVADSILIYLTWKDKP